MITTHIFGGILKQLIFYQNLNDGFIRIYMLKKSTLLIFPLLLVAYEVAVYLANDMYLPALPQIMHALVTTHSLTQLTLTSWMLGATVLQPFMGPIADRYGRRPVLLFGGLIFMITTTICAMALHIMTLIIARFFQGMVVSFVAIPGYAVIHELFDQHQAIKTLTLMGSITILAPSCGPMLGSVVLYFGDWRLIFGILVIWGAIAICALYRYMPKDKLSQNKPIQIKQVLSDYRKIISTRGFLTNALAFYLVFCGMIAWIAAGPFLVISQFHYSAFAFAFCQMAVFGSFIAGNRAAGIMINKMPIDQMINRGLVIVLVGGLAAIILTLIIPHLLLSLILPLMLYAGGSGLIFSSLQRLAIEACSEPMGSRMTIFFSGMSAFGMLGTLFANIFYNGQLISLAMVFGITAVLACALQWAFQAAQEAI